MRTYQPRGSRLQHKDDVERLVKRGYRYGEIAETLGISFEAVRRIVSDYDMPYRYANKPGRPKD